MRTRNASTTAVAAPPPPRLQSFISSSQINIKSHLSRTICEHAGMQITPSQKHKKNEDKNDKQTHTHRIKKNTQKTYKQTKRNNQISRATCPGPSASRLACRFHRSRLKRMDHQLQNLLLCLYIMYPRIFHDIYTLTTPLLLN